MSFKCSSLFIRSFIHCLKSLVLRISQIFIQILILSLKIHLSINECMNEWFVLMSLHLPVRLTASDIMEPNLTYVYPHTRIQSLVSILRTTVYHAFPVVTENRDNEKEFMKGNILISNNIKFKVQHHTDYTSVLTTRWCKWCTVLLAQ